MYVQTSICCDWLKPNAVTKYINVMWQPCYKDLLNICINFMWQPGCLLVRISSKSSSSIDLEAALSSLLLMLLLSVLLKSSIAFRPNVYDASQTDVRDVEMTNALLF